MRGQYKILAEVYAQIGKHAGTKNEVDAHELDLGIESEMEHTDDKKVAEQIALDHLAEDPHYYSKLKKAKL